MKPPSGSLTLQSGTDRHRQANVSKEGSVMVAAVRQSAEWNLELEGGGSKGSW